MQRVKTNEVVDGPGPSEKVATITTSGGIEQVVLHSSALDSSNYMEIGFLGYKEDLALIELPRESASGKWRVWVNKSELAA
ncbi:hypothetical protein [Acidocella sp.]|uniref:hypothetical protein n=1 Tax=Acidocella sp. TaxID=50710 RepID=UPI0026099253|nr:hypothetical protein [Acidocella sp.]